MFTLKTLDGSKVNIDLEDVDNISVDDEGMTDDDYTDAELYTLTLETGEEYSVNLNDNRDNKEYLWDLFETM